MKSLRFSLPAIFIVVITFRVKSLKIEIKDPNVPTVSLPYISTAQKLNAVKAGEKIRSETEEHEKQLKERHVVMDSAKPAYLNAVTKKLSSKTYGIAAQGEVALQASIQLADSNNLSKDQRRYGAIQLPQTSFSSCFESIECDNNSRYRTFDGSCNNLANPRWGQANTPFIRNLAADYGDSTNTPRTSVTGAPLPSARVVSVQGTDSNDDPHWRFTHILMQWGQFLDHDITLTPIVTAAEHDITCCDNGTVRPASDLHSGCLPISIPESDAVYGRLSVTCMEFVRSAPVTAEGCTFGARQQMNINSAYIDASNVYGSDDELADDLREHVGGRLRVFSQRNRDLLPPDDHPEEDCHNTQNQCFLAGDVRVNEQPDLAVMHTVWMREHNRIVDVLADLNPTWNDERLYQEARRIVAAEMQHITYQEWLPKILGKRFMRKNGLNVGSSEYSYDETVDGSITNEFATAAFRFGHTLIQEFLEGYDNSQNMNLNLQLRDVFFTGDVLYEEDTLDSLIRGLTRQKCQKYDRNINPELTSQLYRGTDRFGLDLIALNVQRGREHGIPSYTAFREACGLFVPNTIAGLERIVGSTNTRMLQRIYNDIDDIDLFIGGILEFSSRESLIGETFRCILGNQFERLKYGDRFYFENREDPSTSFTNDQILAIRNSSLSRVLCDNGDNILSLPEDAFTVNFKRHYHHHGGHYGGHHGGHYGGHHGGHNDGNNGGNQNDGSSGFSCQDTRRIKVVDLSLWKE